jgi:hypothetical protein
MANSSFLSIRVDVSDDIKFTSNVQKPHRLFNPFFVFPYNSPEKISRRRRMSCSCAPVQNSRIDRQI